MAVKKKGNSFVFHDNRSGDIAVVEFETSLFGRLVVHVDYSGDRYNLPHKTDAVDFLSKVIRKEITYIGVL